VFLEGGGGRLHGQQVVRPRTDDRVGAHL
jgi:hypothetical protein